MSSEIHFTKMHGTGNDYVYIDCSKSVPDRLSELAKEMSPRHTAIGSDGIILILPSEIADFKMRIFNADGSEARMCGNGSRCVGKYVYDHSLTRKTDLTLETLSGVKYLHLKVNPSIDKVDDVTVDMGKPSFVCQEIGMTIDGSTYIDSPISTTKGEFAITAVSMGNPHGVVFVDKLTDELITNIGREMELSDIWTDRANIEFIKVIDRHTLEMRVWERGSGETMACGTGACAAAAAAVETSRADFPITVNLLGGDVIIDQSPHGTILMTGNAVESFSGIWRRDD